MAGDPPHEPQPEVDPETAEQERRRLEDDVHPGDELDLVREEMRRHDERLAGEGGGEE